MVTQVTPTGLAHTGMWNGTRLEGAQFTEQQKAKMILKRGSLAGWDVRVMKLKRPREPNESDRMAARPREQCFDVIEVDCPVLRRGAEFDLILTPGGDEYRAPMKRK